MSIRGLCARRTPPIGHRSNSSQKWYPISLKGIPPRPFIYKTPLTLDIDFDLSRTICAPCYRENKAAQNDCSNTHRAPPPLTHPLAEIRDELTLNSLCENMSRLCDASTETFLETRTSFTQTCVYLPLAVHAVECALSPTSDARRALSRGINMEEPLVVQTRGSRHCKGYLQLPIPVSDTIVGSRAVRQRSAQVHKCLQFLANGSPLDSTIAETCAGSPAEHDVSPGLRQLQAKVRAQLLPPDHESVPKQTATETAGLLGRMNSSIRELKELRRDYT